MSPLSFTLGSLGPAGVVCVALMLALASGPQGAHANGVSAKVANRHARALQMASQDLSVFGALVPLSAAAVAAKPWTAIRTDMMATGSLP